MKAKLKRLEEEAHNVIADSGRDIREGRPEEFYRANAKLNLVTEIREHIKWELIGELENIKSELTTIVELEHNPCNLLKDVKKRIEELRKD